MPKPYDFLAQITLLTDVPYPKLKGVCSGYQPHHLFCGLDFLVSGIHYYADQILHYPGENLAARIKILHWPCVQNFVQIGTGFWISEASRKVGAGVVIALAQPIEPHQFAV